MINFGAFTKYFKKGVDGTFIKKLCFCHASENCVKARAPQSLAFFLASIFSTRWMFGAVGNFSAFFSPYIFAREATVLTLWVLFLIY